MWPSVVPRLATDSAVRVFPGVWKLLSFLRFPSQDGAPSLHLLSFLTFIFFLPPFKDNGLLFWVPDVLCRHSEVVLWNLLSVQMFFFFNIKLFFYWRLITLQYCIGFVKCSFDEFVGEKVVSLSWSSAILVRMFLKAVKNYS